MSDEKNTALETTDAKSAALAALGDDGVVGLEDFDATTDMVTPRINLLHTEGLFEDNLTGEKFESLRVVLLGLVKQRIMWPEEMGTEPSKPLCKSFDFRQGVPGEKFPWGSSVFDADEHGDEATLPCDACNFKEWLGSNPPQCAVQHTYPLMMSPSGGDDFVAPAMVTFQRSGIKPSKAYVTGFARANMPLFTAVTTITLKKQKRGSVNYAVPEFSKVGDTDPDLFPEFAENFRRIRDFLREPPASAFDSSEEEGNGATTSASANKSKAADDGDVPW